MEVINHTLIFSGGRFRNSDLSCTQRTALDNCAPFSTTLLCSQRIFPSSVVPCVSATGIYFYYCGLSLTTSSHPWPLSKAQLAPAAVLFDAAGPVQLLALVYTSLASEERHGRMAECLLLSSSVAKPVAPVAVWLAETAILGFLGDGWWLSTTLRLERRHQWHPSLFGSRKQPCWDSVQSRMD